MQRHVARSQGERDLRWVVPCVISYTPRMRVLTFSESIRVEAPFKGKVQAPSCAGLGFLLATMMNLAPLLIVRSHRALTMLLFIFLVVGAVQRTA